MKRENLEKNLIEDETKKEKVALTLKNFEENTTTIARLKERKTRLEKERQEVTKQLAFLKDSYSNVLADMQVLNTKLVEVSQDPAWIIRRQQFIAH